MFGACQAIIISLIFSFSPRLHWNRRFFLSFFNETNYPLAAIPLNFTFFILWVDFLCISMTYCKIRGRLWNCSVGTAVIQGIIQPSWRSVRILRHKTNIPNKKKIHFFPLVFWFWIFHKDTFVYSCFVAFVTGVCLNICLSAVIFKLTALCPSCLLFIQGKNTWKILAHLAWFNFIFSVPGPNLKFFC